MEYVLFLGSNGMERPVMCQLPGDPGSILRCFGEPLRCPWGPPESCAKGRDPSSPACSACLPNLPPQQETCVPCAGEGESSESSR